MTAATEKIAEEEFGARVSEKRTDELGKLGGAINHLAKRLSGFVTGQKRFLGDISHELNSPLARMQFALSILEDRVDENNRAYVADVKEEVELMSKLVGELLTYSKAGIKTTQVNLESVRLKPLVEMIVERETATENVDIKMEVSENLEALAQPELLARALGNVVRNAVRYAGRAGMIRVSAENGNNQVKIIVADSGAGVPDADIEKLFDPFYRIESDRSRQTGGIGLGLAIVKTCVEACQGKVFAENRSPGGFAIILLLKSSKAETKKAEE
ncbi:MAG: HAMP domain-containing sensor histidine kinase [Pyrinomonadaceae bacterium]